MLSSMPEMIRLSSAIAIHNLDTRFSRGPRLRAPNPLCYHARFPEPIEMKRLPLVLAGFFAIAALPLAAATVTGKVAFVTKRGQNPVPAETLVWIEPLTSRALRVVPANYQTVTRNKTRVPHVLAIPVGWTVIFPNDAPIPHHPFS